MLRLTVRRIRVPKKSTVAKKSAPKPDLNPSSVRGEGYSYFNAPENSEILTRIPIVRRLGHKVAEIQFRKKFLTWVLGSRKLIFGAVSLLGIAGYVSIIVKSEIGVITAILLIAISILFVSMTLFVVFAGVFEVEDEADSRLHLISHFVRDNQHAVLEGFRVDPKVGVAKIDDLFAPNTANNIAEYYQLRLRDASVGCCIRMLVVKEDQKKKPGRWFLTMARSKNLFPQRASHSEPIRADEGIAKLFKDKNGFGVCVITDLEKAINIDKMWKETPTDKFEDIRYLMIAPINGFETGSMDKKTFGLLFISSSHRPIPETCCHSLKAIADLLGMALPRILAPLAVGPAKNADTEAEDLSK